MWRCKKGLEIRHLGGAERFKTARQSAKVALETKKHQLYNVLWKVRDAKAQLYDVFSKVRETNIQLYDVFLEAGDAKPSFYYRFLKARDAKSSFYANVFDGQEGKNATLQRFSYENHSWKAIRGDNGDHQG